MALFAGKKERVHGRLVLKGEQPSAVSGHQITLAFVPAVPGGPPPKKLIEQQIAGSCTVLTLTKLEYEVELEPGHYQLVARCRSATLDGPRIAIGSSFADAMPLPKAIEVRKGAPMLLNLPLAIPRPDAAPAPSAPGAGPSAPRGPSASAPGAQGGGRPKSLPMPAWSQAAKVVAVVWASDDRIHVHPWRARAGVEDRLNAQVPPNSRRAFEIANQHLAEGRLDRALSGFRQALDAFDPELHPTLPEWLLQVQLAIARCLLTPEGYKEALGLLANHLARGKSQVAPVPIAVELLGTTAAATAIAGELDVVERLTMQMLALVLRGEGPRDEQALQSALESRKKVLQRFTSRAEPERLLEYLDKETALLGDPSNQLAGGMARFQALAKLGRGGAASAFGRKLLNNLELEGGAEAQEAVGTLRKELRELMAGGDPNLIHSSASVRRPKEIAFADRLIAAATQGQTSELESLAREQPGKLDTPAQGFRTALMMAAGAGQAGAVHWLVERGARVHLTGSDSRTPLLLAAEAGHAEVVTYLLSKGAAIDHRDHSLQTALHLAAANNRAHVVLTLIQRSAPLDARDVSHDTPLTLGAAQGAAEVIPMLVSAGADPNERADDGVTALMKAARFGQAGAVQALLQAGADKNLQDDGGHTALEWATRAQQAAAARLLT